MKKANILRGGFTLIELLVVITIIAILASLALPVYSKIQERGNIIKGTNNVRQIGLALKLFAQDNNGAYPTGADANVAFRQLVIQGQVDNEAIFGSPASVKGLPDGNLGTSATTYAEAVTAGENHWEMTDGLNDSSSGSFPLAWENSVTQTWNPQWNSNAAGTSASGRTWGGGRVIVLLNDGSVSTYIVVSRSADSTPLANLGAGTTNLFTAATTTTPTVLAALAPAGG